MHWKTYRIVPNQQTQEYIAKVGESFIPAHQKDLPADDPLKIPFCFYLVEARNFNAVSYPSEGVVVNSAFSTSCKTRRNLLLCSLTRFRTPSSGTLGKRTNMTGRN
jgi:predicted Zn-dependent protease